MDENAANSSPLAETADSSAAGASVCANCATQTTGKFCRHCGQRLDTYTPTFGHFLGEAAEVLTHADSSVWRTLVPLMTRPGHLTQEYLAGRRARYLQPFRLYVVLSVLFLVLASLVVVRTPHARIQAGPVGAEAGIQVQGSCQHLQTDLPGANWLRPRLVIACESFMADSGRELGQNFAHNLGRAMFVFLPLLAVIMKLMYWRPRHYYVEHLLLLVHNHAFVYLWMALYLLCLHWLHTAGWETLLSLVMFWYLGRHLYRSMKVVYGQGAALTGAKFTLLASAYLVCALLMLALTTLITAVAL